MQSSLQIRNWVGLNNKYYKFMVLLFMQDMNL